MVRDSQRSRVYAAEHVFSGDADKAISLDQAQRYVDEVVASAWWSHRSRLRHVSVKAGARGGRAWAHYDSIRTSPGGRRKWVLLHELAHILTVDTGYYSAVAPHGPEFCANFVALARQFLGQEQGDKLRESFREHRVKVRGAVKPKVRRVRCSECNKQITERGAWRTPHLDRSRYFCTKRCGQTWLLARLVKP